MKWLTQGLTKSRRISSGVVFSHDGAGKAVYAGNTEQALAAVVFGVPGYILDGELFWGQDRLDFLDRAVGDS